MHRPVPIPDGGAVAVCARLRLLVIGLVCVAVAPLVAARPPAPARGFPTAPARLDFNGDPLPAGATARVGTVRFRHDGSVFAIAFSPDGRVVYSLCHGANTFARRWDVASGRERGRFGGTDRTLGLDVSPDGLLLATAEASNVVRLWNADTGEEVRRIAVTLPEVGDGRGGARPQFARWVRFGPGGKTLIAQFGQESVVVVWDTATGDEVRRWPNEPSDGLAVSADGRRLATSHGNRVRVVEAATGEVMRTFNSAPAANNPVQAAGVALGPDGTTVVTFGEDGSLRFWDTGTGTETRRGTFSGTNAIVAWSRDGSTLAVAVENADEKTVVSLVDPATGKELRRLDGFVPSVNVLEFSPDGKTLATGGAGQTIRLWVVATGKEIRPAGGHAGPVTTIAVSPDGRLSATCSVHDTSVRLWDAETGAEVSRLDGHTTGVDEVTFSPDGKLLASAAWNQPVLVWDVGSGRIVRKLENHTALGAYLRFADDNKTLATGNHGNAIALWDCTTGKVVRELASPPHGLASLLSFHDGRLLAYERPDTDDDREETIGLWDVTANRPVRRFAGHNGRVNSVILSADGRLLASRATDKTIRVWEVATGAERLRFKEPGSMQQTGSWTGTQFLAFSPDGRVLVTAATDDPFARRWDLATRQELTPLVGHRGWVGAVEFAANCRVLVTGSQDTTALVWEASAVLPPAPGAAVRRADTELGELWNDLRGRDAAKAHAAIWALVGSGDGAVVFIGAHLRPTPPADEAQIARWIADLDREQFATRERATAALVQVADQAEVALRGAIERTRSAEVRQRIRRILDAVSDVDPSPERLQQLRAVEVLELIATPAAQQRLQGLAEGAPGALLTREVQAALRRWARRSTS